MDLARTHFGIRVSPKKWAQILNINLALQGSSVMELINIFQDINKIKIPYEIKGRRVGDLPQLLLIIH